MNRNIIELSRRYVAALRKSLKRAPRSSTQALSLGRQAVTLGVDTLGLVQIHKRSLGALELSPLNRADLSQANTFFTEAIAPIIEARRVMRLSGLDLRRLNGTLRRRTAELATTNRQLEKCILHRKRAETTFRKSGEHYAKLLEESLRMQGNLRQLTRQALATQENERKNFSRELQDEIAQTLLGINARLLSLNNEALDGTKVLQKGIVSAQHLVIKSARSMFRITRGFRKA